MIESEDSLRDKMVNPLQIISLGAGVQSSTMALMAAHGEITPMPDAAIFANVGDGCEPQEVYDWLEYLKTQLPFPVYTVSNQNLREEQLKLRTSKKTGNVYARTLIPAFIDGAGILGRKCTADHKVTPLRKKARQLAGIHGRQCKELKVIQWLGISLDEIQRMKVSIELWQEFRHPLIELRMTRQDCLDWMKSHGYPAPPRSACSFCPFHSDKEWMRVKASPEWESVIQFERDLQAIVDKQTGTARLSGLPYLHGSRKPIDEVIFKPNRRDEQRDMFADECAGMCGV